MKRFIFVALTVAIIAGAAISLWIWQSVGGISPGRLEARYMTEADRFVEIGQARVRVREEGASEGTPIILLHGFTFSLESWDGWAALLSEDYRVIRFDLLGHGLTGPDPQGRYGPMERVELLRDLMDALEIDRAHIVGNSLGGLVAWRFAARYPERVSSLILVDPGAYPINGVTDVPAPIPPAIEVLLRTAPEMGVRAMLNYVFYDDAQVTEERVERVRDMMRRRGNGAAFIDHLKEFVLPDPEPDLAGIDVPTLIMWGGQDVLISPTHGRLLAQAMPRARLVVYENLGHVPHEEAPAETASDALSFLNNLVGDRE